MKLPRWFTLKPQENLLSDEEMRDLVSTSTPGIPYEELVCQHEWKERTKSYAPPRREMDGTVQDPELASMILLGVTTIIDECVACGELRKNSVLGNPDPQLDEILDNVLSYGPQYMQRNNATFVFQRYFPPAQPAGIPLR